MTRSISSLPDEIQLQILAKLDPQSLLSLGACNKTLQQFIQDDSLCISIIKAHFPLAHARMAVEAELREKRAVSWADQLRRTNVLYNCLTQRKSLDYYELHVGRDLPSAYAENLGSTPRERHSAKYNFNTLVLYYTGIGLFVIVDLAARETREVLLPGGYSIRDVYIEEEVIVVLTTRASQQLVLTYTVHGQLLRTLDTERADLAFIMANEHYILVYSIDFLCWFYYDATDTQAPIVEEQLYIRQSAGSTLQTQALDDTYFYQKQDISPNRSVLLIYHLGLGYVVSRISLHPGKNSTYSEISGVNRHVYLSSHEQFTHIRGLEMVEMSLPGVPREDDAPIWDSKMLADLGAWIGWMGEDEDAIQYGLFTMLLREPSTGSIRDCGRLRGASEPHDQHKTKNVSLLGDEKWIICVSNKRVFVWQLQR